MNIDSITDIIEQFVTDSSFKSILIDGPWGCGKTYKVNEFLKKNRKIKIHYLSLFGLESIKEIKSALYLETTVSNCWFKNFLNSRLLNLKSIKPFVQLGEATVGLDFQLGVESNKSAKNKSLIIFDDLERLSKKVDYSDLLGCINSLFLSNCRIICVMSSSNIADENRMNEFNDFKEKVFDCVYKINEPSNYYFYEIFKDYGFDKDEEAYKLFDSNLRMARRAETLYKSLQKFVEDNKSNIEHKNISKGTILKGCAYAVKVVYHNFNIERTKDDEIEESILNQLEPHRFSPLEKDLADISKDEKYKRDFDYPSFYRIVLSLIKCFLYRDYSEFKSIFRKAKSNDIEDLLSQGFYYMSDEKKKRYLKEFESMVTDESSIWEGKLCNAFYELLKYYEPNFDLKVKNAIANKIYEDCENECDAEREIINCMAFVEKQCNKLLLDELKSIIEDIRDKDLINQLESAFKKSDFEKMSKVLLKIRGIGQCGDFITSNLVEHKFFIPDISKDINIDIWHYCHDAAILASKNKELKDSFVKLARDECKKQKSKSQVDRFSALLRYDLHETL